MFITSIQKVHSPGTQRQNLRVIFFRHLSPKRQISASRGQLKSERAQEPCIPKKECGALFFCRVFWHSVPYLRIVLETNFRLPYYPRTLPQAGTIIFKLLQKEAAHARWKDEYRKKLKALKAKVT